MYFIFPVDASKYANPIDHVVNDDVEKEPETKIPA
jgi:hypothetical protein